MAGPQLATQMLLACQMTHLLHCQALLSISMKPLVLLLLLFGFPALAQTLVEVISVTAIAS